MADTLAWLVPFHCSSDSGCVKTVVQNRSCGRGKIVVWQFSWRDYWPIMKSEKILLLADCQFFEKCPCVLN